MRSTLLAASMLAASASQLVGCQHTDAPTAAPPTVTITETSTETTTKTVVVTTTLTTTTEAIVTQESSQVASTSMGAEPEILTVGPFSAAEDCQNIEAEVPAATGGCFEDADGWYFEAATPS